MCRSGRRQWSHTPASPHSTVPAPSWPTPPQPLKEVRRCYCFARAEIGEANRTVRKGVQYSPDRRLSPQRVRERKSYAFKLLNRRRRELNAAERRLVAAQQAFDVLSAI